jgi:hypothetical protein
MSISGVESHVATGATVAGGIWAYFKFVKTRVLNPRLPLNVSGQLVSTRDRTYLHLRVALRNPGLTNVALDLDPANTRGLLFLEVGKTSDVVWQPLTTFDPFAGESAVEPSEELSEEHLLALPSWPLRPIKVEVWLSAKSGVGWTSSTIIVPEKKEATNGD